MLNLFFVTLSVFSLFIIGMAVGVLMGRRPISGSCGGLGAIMGKACSFCDRKGECKKKKHRQS